MVFKPPLEYPPVNLEKIFNRFTKAKKEITVNDLQHEIKETKSEIKTLKEEVKKLDQALTILRIDHNFLNQRIEHQDNTSHQGHNEAGPSYQNPSDSEEKNVYDESTNLIANMVLAKIREFEEKLKQEVCSDLPTTFWHRKRHEVALPYVKDFKEKDISTKARPIQMSQELIRNSKSPWSCSAFYVQKNAEIERGVPKLVINYKPLNKVLEWVRYLIPNKRDLVNRLSRAVIFSKFDMKNGFSQIQIKESDRYKTAFTTTFGHYE